MPWPAIAAIAGKVIGGLGASGAAGAGAAGAGASGAGGMLGGMGGKGLMSMMGGSGGQGGGMLKGAMQNMPKIGETGQAIQGGLVNLLEANNGVPLDPKLWEYLLKMQGAGTPTSDQMPAQTPPIGQIPTTTDNTSMASSLEPGAGMQQVAAQDLPDAAGSASAIAMPNQTGMPSLQDPMSQPQQQTMTPENPNDMKTNLPGEGQGAPKKGVAGTVSSLMGMMGKGDYTKDNRGVTQVSETSDILGNSIKKIDPKNPASLATAAVSFVAGKVQQGSERRRAMREEEQLGSDFMRAQQASSVYADPNSVYYSAENGAPIDPSKRTSEVVVTSNKSMPVLGGYRTKQTYGTRVNIPINEDGTFELYKPGESMVHGKSIVNPNSARLKQTTQEYLGDNKFKVTTLKQKSRDGEIVKSKEKTKTLAMMMDGGRIGRIPKKPC